MNKAPIHWRLLSLIFVAAFLLLPTISAAAQEGGGGGTLYLPLILQAPPAVEKIGPSGGTFPAVVVNPLDPAVLYVGTWGLGVQKSLDGGLTWTAKNNGLGNWKIQSMAIHPNGSTLYAGTYGNWIYRSDDGGENWRLINNGLPSDFMIIYDIELDPINPAIIYATMRQPGTYEINRTMDGYVYKSVDGGENWSRIWSGWTLDASRGDYSYDIDVTPDGQTLYLAVHENGVYKSPANATLSSWVKTGAVVDKNARNIAINPLTPTTLYQSVYFDSDGLYKSTDGGATWAKANSGLTRPIYGYALTLDENAPGTLYLGTAAKGIFKSGDSAGTWTYKGLLSQYVWNIHVDGDQIYAATGGHGLQVSANGGTSWQSANEGIYNTNVSSLVILPGETIRMYAAVVGGGVFRTNDQGESWEEINNGLTDLNVNWLFNQGNKLYAVTNSSLFTLDSGAASWTQLAGPQVPASISLEEAAPVEVPEHDVPFSERLLMPEEEQFLLTTDETGADPVDPLVATITKPITAAAEISEGLYVGTNGAGIWLRTASGWIGCGYNDAADPRTVYALFYNPYDGGLYASIDLKTNNEYQIISRAACNNWNANSNSGQIPFAVRTISFAASSARMFAATTNGIYYRPHQTTAWAHAAGITGSVYDIAVDPTNVNLVYAAASTGTYYSTNGGLNWSPTTRSELQGSNFVSVEVDRNNPQIIYFGNKEGGTYQWNRFIG